MKTSAIKERGGLRLMANSIKDIQGFFWSRQPTFPSKRTLGKTRPIYSWETKTTCWLSRPEQIAGRSEAGINSQSPSLCWSEQAAYKEI